MKSVASDKCCKKEIPFPKLMVSDMGAVVLFNCSRIGVCVHKGNGYTEVGGYSSTWNNLVFKDYHGDVCLTNSEE